MGSFYVADCITGETIEDDQPVVGFIVSHSKSYPLNENPNDASLRPTSRFRLESLPLFGQYADYGRMKPDDEDCFAVRLARAMTGTPTWETLMEKGFDHRSGVQLMGKPDGEPTFWNDGKNRRVYGLALMHRSTFDYWLNQPRKKSMADDIDEMLALYDKFVELDKVVSTFPKEREARTPEQEALYMHHFSLFDALGIGQKHSYLDVAGNHVDTPFLCQVFSHDTYGPDIRATLFGSGLHMPHLRATRETEGHPGPAREWKSLVPLLEGLWQAQQLWFGMDHLCAEFRPSMYASQYDNRDAVLKFTLANLENLFKRALARFEYQEPEKAHAALSDMLDKIAGKAEKLRVILDQELDKTLADLADDD